jgi:hypothetical protein
VELAPDFTDAVSVIAKAFEYGIVCGFGIPNGITAF